LVGLTCSYIFLEQSISHWATVWTIRDSIPGSVKRFSSSLKLPDVLWFPPGLLFKGYPLIKGPERAVDHSSPSGDEVKYEWS